MIDTRAHVERYRELPRVWQWIVIATVFLLAFLFWANVLTPLSNGWSEQADRMEVDIQRTSVAATMNPQARNAAITYGTVTLPDTKAVGSLELTSVIQGIMETHGIKNDTFFQSKSSNIKQSTLPGIAKGGEKIERIKGELDFQAKPSTAMAIIADIESNPAIDAVSSVKIDKGESGKVRARLSIEAWVRSR